jgi:hypothetical protein
VWALETVKRESHIDILDGKENPIDEENRTKVPVGANDPLFECIDAAIGRIQLSVKRLTILPAATPSPGTQA